MSSEQTSEKEKIKDDLGEKRLPMTDIFFFVIFFINNDLD